MIQALGAGPADPILRRELRGGALVLARAVALTVGAIMAIVWLHLLPTITGSIIEQARSSAPAGETASIEKLALVQIGITVASAVLWIGCGAFAFWRRSHDFYGNVALVCLVGLALLSDPAQVTAIRSDPWTPVPVMAFLTATGVIPAFAYAFPDGRFVPSWTIAIVALAGVWSVLRMFSGDLDPSRLGLPGIVLFLAIYMGILPAWKYRYERRSNPAQRQQLKWLFYGLTLFLVGWAADYVVRITYQASFTGLGGFEIKLVVASAHGLGALILAASTLAAIFRLGLLDIDLLINRTALYGAITTLLVGVFVLVNALTERVLGPTGDLPREVVALALAGLVALSLFLLRARLFEVADRFVPERRVLTFLFLDMTASTTKAAQLGDRGWRELLNKFRAAVRDQLRRFGGREIDTAGDGFFAVFESPGQAIRCARRIVDDVRPLGVEVRVGLHVGECEVQGNSVIGIGVVIAQRVMSAAPPNEVFVSRTLRDLVAGSDIRFTERGTSILKGVPGEWQLYAVGV